MLSISFLKFTFRCCITNSSQWFPAAEHQSEEGNFVQEYYCCMRCMASSIEHSPMITFFFIIKFCYTFYQKLYWIVHCTWITLNWDVINLRSNFPSIDTTKWAKLVCPAEYSIEPSHCCYIAWTSPVSLCINNSDAPVWWW